jgi:PPP family 3-phenylpropionic acid transporter
MAFSLSFFYAALFAGIGIQLPFWPVWLESKGLSAGEIGILLGTSYLVKIAANPLVGHVVDRLGSRRLPMIVMAAATTVAFGAFALTEGFWPILALTLVATGLFSAIIPIGDNLTLMKTREAGLDYGRIRLWGSLAFIATAVGVGAVLERSTPETILWMFVGAIAITFLSCLALPESAAAKANPSAGGIATLLSSGTFVLFLTSAGLIQVSHMLYYGFGTLHWRANAISDFTIGWLWASGVLAEIVLFAFAGKWAARVGPATLLSLGAAAGILRWTLLATTTDVPLLFAAQLLHGATFGCTHLGAMHFVLRAAPPGLSARAQVIHSSVAAGLVPGIAMPFMGPLYQELGGLAYLAMAALSLLGLLAAWQLGRRWRGQPIGSP